MPDTPQTDRLVSRESLQAVVEAIFAKSGLTSIDAAILAESLVRADCRGMHSHGVLRVAQYLKKIRAGGFKSGRHGTVVSDNDAVIVFDGEDGIGQVLSNRAMRAAIDKARTFGVGLAVVKNSNHHGESGSYATMAAEAGMIGIVTSNGSPSAPVWGGVDPRVTGPWPLAFAVPTGGDPIVLDMSLGVASKGKVQHFADSGKTMPPGWGFDRNGEPTQDPHAVLDGGWSNFIGAYKGWGLLLVIEALTGVLSGGRIADEITDLFAGAPESPQGLSHMMLVIDVAKVRPLDAFRDRMDEMVGKVKGSKLAPGFAEIILPGEPEFRNVRAREKSGIPVNAKVEKDLVMIARDLGVPSVLIETAFPAIVEFSN